MLFKGLEQLFADRATFLAEGVIHPDTLAADIHPAAPFEVGQVT